MFGLDPFSLPVAIGEIVVLLAFTAFVGWLLGRLVLTGRVNALRSAIAQKETELEECRRAKAFRAHVPMTSDDQESIRRETVVTPVSFVSADPLLPAFSHDDTPDLVAEEEPPGRVEVPVDIVSPIRQTSTVVIPPIIMGGPVTGNSEAAVLSRIAARANELNFDRIGRASAAEADDLKDIIGIGPFLERKLHSLGIYTFRQVSNFTKEDINKVNEIIEFFPGRIERDNWVEQSKAFHERKYGATS
jgi:predicted flap endonuclease-1-like 5' DNA nuclease